MSLQGTIPGSIVKTSMSDPDTLPLEFIYVNVFRPIVVSQKKVHRAGRWTPGLVAA
jgi:predicted branched-subunit amino acid permease